MICLGSLLLFVGSMGFGPVPEPARSHSLSDKNDAFVIAVDRSAGLTPRQTKATDYYSFTVDRNGDWEFRPQFQGDAVKGKLSADDLDQWVEDIENGGLDQVESDPDLGARDEPYMDITVHTAEKKTHIRILLTEELSQAIEKKIVELVEPGE